MLPAHVQSNRSQTPKLRIPILRTCLQLGRLYLLAVTVFHHGLLPSSTSM